MTVVLDEQVDLELSCIACEQGSSKEDLMCGAVGSFVQSCKPARALPRFVGASCSNRAYTTEEIDNLLGEVYEEDYKAALASYEAYSNFQELDD